MLSVSILTGCSNANLVPHAATSPDRATCDREAGVLTEEVIVYSAPRSGLKPVAELAKGRPIYRCERRGEWIGVMYPEVNEKADCSERRSGSECPVGWIRHGTGIELLG